MGGNKVAPPQKKGVGMQPGAVGKTYQGKSSAPSGGSGYGMGASRVAGAGSGGASKA